MREFELRSGANWQGALKQKGVKQRSVKKNWVYCKHNSFFTAEDCVKNVSTVDLVI
jgi:hypothetical protein